MVGFLLPVENVMKPYLKPTLTLVGAILMMAFFLYLVPHLDGTHFAPLASFVLSLIKAGAVIAAARLALAYFDERAGINVNNWLRNTANGNQKAIYFSARFFVVVLVFGFVVA